MIRKVFILLLICISLKANLQEHLPELTFIGTSFYGVGIADCVANAKMTAEEYINKIL